MKSNELLHISRIVQDRVQGCIHIFLRDFSDVQFYSDIFIDVPVNVLKLLTKQWYTDHGNAVYHRFQSAHVSAVSDKGFYVRMFWNIALSWIDFLQFLQN